jgi:hypothetical protein
MDPRRRIHLLVAALLVAAALPGQAGVYKWVDESGKVTYTDTPPPDAAGKSEAVAVEQKISVMGMDPAIRAAAERRFAAEAEAEERDWQRRQQAMFAQQAAQAAAQAAAPAVSTLDSYYPYYYAPYYRVAYYPASSIRGPYYGHAIHKVPPRAVRQPPRVKHHSPRAAGPSRPGFAPRAGSAPRPGARPR